MKYFRFFAIVVSFLAPVMLHAQGNIVPNGVVYIGGILNEIDVLSVPSHIPPSGGDYTGFTLYPQNINAFQYSYIANQGIRVFLVSPNDPVSLQAIQLQNYTELLSPNSYVFDVGSPFYVGLYTGKFPTGGIFPDPVFGWALLENVNGSIQLLDSALEYGGAGIYAGTQTIIVPEPSTLGLLSLGGLFLGWRWRKSLR